jgi:hypothetical protein
MKDSSTFNPIAKALAVTAAFAAAVTGLLIWLNF